MEHQDLKKLDENYRLISGRDTVYDVLELKGEFFCFFEKKKLFFFCFLFLSLCALFLK